MTLQLHAWPRSSSTRVSWALEELGLPYEYVELDPQKNEHRSARHLALHPMGKVPALVDGELRLFESGAILVHLGQTYGVERGLWPAGGQARADALCWTVWAMTELGGFLLQYLYHGLDTPVSFAPAQRSAAAADYSHSQLMRCLDALQARLQDREHVLGGFTLADVACDSWLGFGTMFGVTLQSHPAVAAWHARCQARPALQRAR